MLLKSIENKNMDLILDVYNTLKKSTTNFCKKHNKELQLKLEMNKLTIIMK